MPDNESPINCPACGKRMHKIFMPVQKVNLDVCLDGCGGILFDNREYKMFANPQDDISPLIEAYENKTFTKTNDFDLRICPVCGMKMVKNFAGEKRAVRVDDCYGCGARFLDYEELEKVRFSSTAQRYSKRPVVMPSNYYNEISGNTDSPAISNEVFNENNSADYDPFENNPDYDNSYAPLYTLDESAVIKKEIKKGALTGMLFGLLISFVFFDKFKDLYPIFKECNLQLDYAFVDLIIVLLCTLLCACTGAYISYRKYKRF